MDGKALELLRLGGFTDADIADLESIEPAAEASPVWRTFMEENPVWSDENPDAVWERVTSAAPDTGLPANSVGLLYLAKLLPALAERCASEGVDESVAAGCARDLKHKLDECRVMFGICGTNSFAWHVPFFRLQRWALGRMQYERRVYTGPDVEIDGIAVRTGDLIYGMHIPSGEPFTREARLDSYRRAYAFFGCSEEKPLIVDCNTWLLNPRYATLLSAPSNLLDFMSDFTPVGWDADNEYRNAWRAIGPACALPPEQWPEDNRLQRILKAERLAGRPAYRGEGLLILRNPAGDVVRGAGAGWDQFGL